MTENNTKVTITNDLLIIKLDIIDYQAVMLLAKMVGDDFYNRLLENTKREKHEPTIKEI